MTIAVNTAPTSDRRANRVREELARCRAAEDFDKIIESLDVEIKKVETDVAALTDQYAGRLLDGAEAAQQQLFEMLNATKAKLEQAQALRAGVMTRRAKFIEEAPSIERTHATARSVQAGLREDYAEFHRVASELAEIASRIRRGEHDLVRAKEWFTAADRPDLFVNSPLEEIARETGRVITNPLLHMAIHYYWPPHPDGSPLRALADGKPTGLRRLRTMFS
jgi:hypothetical protein